MHSFILHTSPAFALSLSHSLSLFIYLRVCLATAPQCEALQQWVNLPPYWWEMEGQMMLSDCRQGEGLKRFRSENHLFSVKVRSQRSGARCDLEQQFLGTLLSLRITHLQTPQMLRNWIVSHSPTSSLPQFTPSLLSSCLWSMRHMNYFLECSHSQGRSELLIWVSLNSLPVSGAEWVRAVSQHWKQNEKDKDAERI